LTKFLFLKAIRINYPIILTPKEYYALVAKDNLRNYYKEKIDAFDGKKEGSEDERKNLLPEFYVDSGFFESIFGSNVIEMVPQGSVEMDLGVLFSRQDNPSFSPRQRSNFTFDFDQRISLSLLGKVGTRLQVTANYDTQSTFDFQQLIKLEYTPTEDDIIQKIEVGNVNMPLNSSLITGAQSLFGVKAQLQFGRTTVTGVFSEQQSQANTVVAQGGGTLEEFEFFIREYDENRHFFLAQYFRDTYDNALVNYPFINNKGLQITRLEVWITNRSNRTENVRNIVAVQDLGESDKVFSTVPVFAGPGAFPDNANNGFNPLTIETGGSSLSPQIRDISTADQGFGVLSATVNEGSDYAKLENARKLLNGQEYTLNTELGYISLNQRLNNDEPLNFISPVGDSFDLDINGNPVNASTPSDDLIENSPLLRVFNLDKLNFNNDPQSRGDGFFDYVPGITVIPQNGKIVFTSAEPFGEHLFNVLGGGDYDDDNTLYNENQQKYVYDILYKSTKIAALDEVEKNKFKLKGRYTSE